MRIPKLHLQILTRRDGEHQLSLTDGHNNIILFEGTEEQVKHFASCTFSVGLIWNEGPWSRDSSVTVPRALLAVPEYPLPPEFVPPTTGEEWVKVYKVHPSIVRDHLTNKDGSIRIPSYSEWNEDFGLGYGDRLAWERDRGEYTT